LYFICFICFFISLLRTRGDNFCGNNFCKSSKVFPENCLDFNFRMLILAFVICSKLYCNKLNTKMVVLFVFNTKLQAVVNPWLITDHWHYQYQNNINTLVVCLLSVLKYTFCFTLQKICQNRPKVIKMATYSSSLIFKFSNFWLPIRLGGIIRVIIPHYIKIC